MHELDHPLSAQWAHLTVTDTITRVLVGDASYRGPSQRLSLLKARKLLRLRKKLMAGWNGPTLAQQSPSYRTDYEEAWRTVESATKRMMNRADYRRPSAEEIIKLSHA